MTDRNLDIRRKVIPCPVLGNRGVVVFSGGMDSATLLWMLKTVEKHEVTAVSVDYGQRHRRELEYAKLFCETIDVEHIVIELPISQLAKDNALTGGTAVPHGHYAEETMKQTVVPNRNMIMLSMAASLAMDRKLDYVAYGAHDGDHAIYPDCRPEFIKALSAAIKLADWHKVHLWGPFAYLSKGEIATLGLEAGVPYDATWTCYEGGEEPCGKCGSCVERAEALEFARKRS